MSESVSTELLFLTRVLVAGVLAGFLGWERQQAKKPAGFRTHIIVGVAAALFTAISELMILRGDNLGGSQSDPTRTIQAVALGIGFLGSGIIVGGGTGPGPTPGANRTIRGLTTAASVWATAAIGMTAALGYYVLAVGSTLLLLFVLQILGRLEAEHESD